MDTPINPQQLIAEGEEANRALETANQTLSAALADLQGVSGDSERENEGFQAAADKEIDEITQSLDEKTVKLIDDLQVSGE